MRTKNITSVAVLLVVFLYFLPGDVFPQSPWDDGTPTFTKTRAEKNVIVDATISLLPREGAHRDSSFVVLNGFDWSWPIGSLNISSATDIDYRKVNDRVLYLVTDAQGRRIIEVDTAAVTEEGALWLFGSQTVGEDTYLDKPVDTELFTEDGRIKCLITDEGLNRVIKVDKELKIIQWQYGDETEGNGFNQLASPADAVRLPGVAQYLICDRGNNRIIQVDEATWMVVDSLGATNVEGSLDFPVDVEYDSTENAVLITDQGNHRVIIVDWTTKVILWQFGITDQPGSSNQKLNKPTDADFLSNGDILICDNGNNRLIEVSRNGTTGSIVWSFDQPLKSLVDADRLPDGYTLVITDRFPKRLGYDYMEYSSDPGDLGKNVNLDKLYWDADLPENTSIKFQLKTGNSLDELDANRFVGPGGVNTFYTEQGMVINKTHDGDRFYQFKAFLRTANPLVTPTLHNLKIAYHFYSTHKDSAGVAVSSELIGETPASGAVVAKWQSLEFKTILDTVESRRDEVYLEVRINDKNGNFITNFVASTADSNNVKDLSVIEPLKTKQQIQLALYLKTNNSAVSPILDSWLVRWKRVVSGESKVQFVNADGDPVPNYRATTFYPAPQENVDKVFISLRDANLSAVQDEDTLRIHSVISGDNESVTLGKQSSGEFRLRTGVPLIISENVLSDNSILEVFDRDTLIVSYQDKADPNDKSTDRILVIQTSPGNLQIENVFGTKVDTVDIGDTLYVRVTEEYDNNITTNQDTIWVDMFDNATDDLEYVKLLELPDTLGTYDTGNFRSQGVVLVQGNNGIDFDGQIQTLPGHHVGVNYSDNVLLQDDVWIPPSGVGPDTTVFIYLGGAAFNIEVAPNPYHEHNGDKFRMRIASSTGSLKVRFIEIFNFAGEKLREIDGAAVRFGAGDIVPKDRYGIAEFWWDLKNESGQKVASGTYWAKVHADLRNAETGNLEQISAIKKFVLIR